MLLLSPNPSVFIGISVVAIAYIVATRRSRVGVSRLQSLAFGTGLLAVLMGFNGPLAYLEAHRLFSALIAEHLLLIMVAPPLLLLGLPPWLTRSLFRPRLLRLIARAAAQPIFALAVFAVAFVGVHTQAAVALMVGSKFYRDLLRLALLVAGLFVWWPVVNPLPELPRPSYPVQVLYLFAQLIPLSAIAAPISVAESVRYPFFAHGVHPLGLSPLADQVLGGLLMWVGAGLYIIFVFTLVFYRWAAREDREGP